MEQTIQEKKALQPAEDLQMCAAK